MLAAAIALVVALSIVVPDRFPTEAALFVSMALVLDVAATLIYQVALALGHPRLWSFRFRSRTRSSSWPRLLCTQRPASTEQLPLSRLHRAVRSWSEYRWSPGSCDRPSRFRHFRSERCASGSCRASADFSSRSHSEGTCRSFFCSPATRPRPALLRLQRARSGRDLHRLAGIHDRVAEAVRARARGTGQCRGGSAEADTNRNPGPGACVARRRAPGGTCLAARARRGFRRRRAGSGPRSGGAALRGSDRARHAGCSASAPVHIRVRITAIGLVVFLVTAIVAVPEWGAVGGTAAFLAGTVATVFAAARELPGVFERSLLAVAASAAAAVIMIGVFT